MLPHLVVLPPLYDPRNWYWIVAGDESRYWSSAVGAYVDGLPEGAGLTRIDTEESLTDVLAAYGLRGPVTRPEDVIAERARRLAGGFVFDFGDPRGVHRIGTTEADMAGWSEVTMLAQARLAIGDATPIAIVTDTGPTSVTPAEWLSILLASAAHRQPIWQASFALQTMDPIPADYAEDGYWT